MSAGVSIEKFGSIADGSTLNTQSIQNAIDSVSAAGGGKIIVPPGVFLTGTIFLKNHTVLVLMPGATLKGSPNIADYPRMDWPAVSYHWHHLIVAENAENVGIEGDGCIDGNGPAFWHKPGAAREWIGYDIPRVEKMVIFRNCKSVRVEGVRLENSPAWNLHLFECDDAVLRGIRIHGHMFGPNIDGIDIEGCTDVRVSDCNMECGDDSVVVFPSRNRDCRRVVVTNCVMRTNCVGLKAYNFHSERTVSQLAFSNCIVHGSTRAVGLYNYAGGTIEDITIDNILCDTDSGMWLNRPIQIDVKCRARQPLSKEEMAEGVVRNIFISNFFARTDGRILLTAADGGRVEKITLTNVKLSYPIIDDPRPTGLGFRSDQFPNSSPEACVATAAVVADGIKDLVVEGLQIEWPSEGGNQNDWEGLKDKDGQPVAYPRAESGIEPAFSVLWGRNLQGGFLDNPVTHASNPDMPKYVFADGKEMTVRA